ncbi:MAG: hypothetical protein U9N76_04155 [Candidatus Marinimicrobia bacterium]|nr:hypothetical protein [Candidatus Neomarinimicrobiota bacterium]
MTNETEKKNASKVDDVKESVGKWWNKNKPKLQEMAKTAGEKANEVKEKGRVKYNLFQEKRNLEKLFSELGGNVFDEINDNNNYNFVKSDDVKELVAKIIAEKKVIDKHNKTYDGIGK